MKPATLQNAGQIADVGILIVIQEDEIDETRAAYSTFSLGPPGGTACRLTTNTFAASP